jgi:hypothetical protein
MARERAAAPFKEVTLKKNILENWQTLNESVMKLNEEQLEALLEEEKRGQQRVQFLLRLYGRFNKLRSIRERSSFLKGK